MRSQKNSTRKRVVIVAASAFLLLMAGRAAMASNTVGASTGGYGSAAVSGTTVQSVSYTLSPDGTMITGAALSLVGDLTGKTVSVGFNRHALADCAVGSYTAASNTTSAVCTGLTQYNTTAGTLAVAVHQ